MHYELFFLSLQRIINKYQSNEKRFFITIYDGSRFAAGMRRDGFM